jgi:hypothetical protein
MKGTYYQSGENPALNYIYLYALRPEAGTDGTVDVYLIKEALPVVPNQNYVLGLPARISKLKRKATKIRGLPWRHDSYQVYLMYNSTYRFVPGQAVTFKDQAGPMDNHSFWDGNDIFDDKGKVIAMACLSHRLNGNNKPLGDEGDESESFDVRFCTFPPLREKRLHDETGTNTGP